MYKLALELLGGFGLLFRQVFFRYGEDLFGGFLEAFKRRWHDCTIPFSVFPLKPYVVWSLYEMQQFFGEKFFRIIEDLTSAEYEFKGITLKSKLTNKDREGLNNVLSAIEYNCTLLGLNVTCANLKTAKNKIKSEFYTFKDVKDLLPIIREILIAEVSTVLFLHIDPAKVNYYKQPSLFSTAVDQYLSSAAYDIEEAGKCLALERNTACVFHLMRVMEEGLRVLAEKARAFGIQIPPPESNRAWIAILTPIEKEILKKHNEKTEPWKQVEPIYAEIAAHLRTVSVAWRNPTMHVGTKYTSEEAISIFNSVATFMRHLASKLSE